MGLLTAALPRTEMDDSSKIKSANGVYRAYWLGMNHPYEWVSPFGDQCKLCKGTRRGRNGEGECSSCKGSGKRTEMHTKLIYQLESGQTEEEEVNFKLAPAGQSRDGNVLSPTTLFIRLRAFSGNRQATPNDLDAWYENLRKPIKIPVIVVISDNKAGTASKIADVQLRVAQKTAPAPAPEPEPAKTWAADNFDNDEVPF
jgi:hypothetical protein